MTYGRLVSAGTEIDGSELAVDHLDGVTTLDLEDALAFVEPEPGEVFQVRIVDDDGVTEELVTIKVPETEDEDTVDDEDGFLTLDAPTVNAYDAGTRVEVYPETKRIVAQVRLDDSEEDSETVDAIVDASLWEKIPEGTDLDMAVELAYDGEAYYVVNILGEQPFMDIEAGTITLGAGLVIKIDQEEVTEHGRIRWFEEPDPDDSEGGDLYAQIEASNQGTTSHKLVITVPQDHSSGGVYLVNTEDTSPTYLHVGDDASTTGIIMLYDSSEGTTINPQITNAAGIYYHRRASGGHQIRAVDPTGNQIVLGTFPE